MLNTDFGIIFIASILVNMLVIILTHIWQKQKDEREEG